MPSPLFLFLDFLLTSLLGTGCYILGVHLSKKREATYWFEKYQEILDAYIDLVTTKEQDHV